MLGKIRPSVVFSGAPETLANHWLPTGSISPWVFNSCCCHWFYLPSVQQKRSCFLPCSSLQFSLLPGKTHYSCVSPQLFLFHFCKQRKIMYKLDDLVGSFKQSSSTWSGSFSLHLAHVCCPLQVSLWCPYFWHLKHLGSWDILLNSLKTIADLHLLGSMRLIKCQDVSVGLDSFFAFSDGDSFYVCNSRFSQGWCYLLFCSQCQLPTLDNSLGSVEFLMWVGSAFRCMKGFYF